MVAIYVTSAETFAGKSAICVGLAMRFSQDGIRFGYMKPVSRAARPVAGQTTDPDVAFIKETFSLPEPHELLNPVALTPQFEEAILRGEVQMDFAGRIQDAYHQLAQGREVMLLEAGTNLREGFLIGLPAYRLADILGARELVVARYADNLLDDVLAAREILGDTMLGVVINAVPRPYLGHVSDVLQPYLERHHVPVLGILPEDQLLQSLDVRELAEVVEGRVLCCEDALDQLVEHFMIGAMSVDSALAYFRLKPNKAVITGGDRADIQLAALETSTRCLVLTGNLYPSTVILERAKHVGVPIVLSKYDTMSTVARIYQYFGKTRFHQRKKLARFMELMQERFDFARLYALAGIRKPA